MKNYLSTIKDNIVYHNDMNKFVFKNFNEADFNLFFTICFFAKEQRNNGELISLSFNVLKRFIPNERNKKRFYGNIVEFARKLNSLSTEEYNVDEDGYRKFSINSFFEQIEVDEKNEILSFRISKKSLYLIYEVFQRYTIFDMKDFCEIKGKYTKNLFRLLKQWEGSGKFQINYESFLVLFDIPKSYTAFFIEDKVIKPSIDLPNGKNSKNKVYFANLQYEKIKDKHSKGQGGKIKELIFTFKPNAIRQRITKKRLQLSRIQG